MKHFSQELINLAIAYFRSRRRVEITEAEAETFLASFAEFYALVGEIQEDGRSARPQGGGTLT